MDTTQNLTYEYLSPRQTRVGIIAGVLVFVLYALFDYILLDDVLYLKEWLLRAMVLVPAVLLYGMTYSNKAHKQMYLLLFGLFLFVIIVLGFIIKTAAVKVEVYLLYQFGYLLVLLWAGFVFRIKLWQIVVLSFFIVLSVNVVNLYVHNNIFYLASDWIYGINILLISAVAMVVLGVYHITGVQNEIRKQNVRLLSDQKALRLAKDKAEESDRLKSAFMANMSHEIRTPLNAIAGFAALIAEGGIEKEEQLLFSDCISSNSELLVKMIEEIIEYSRIEAGIVVFEKNSCEVNGVVKSLDKDVDAMKNKKASVSLHQVLWEKNIVFKSDQEKIRHVFKSLIENAIKFSSDGIIKYGVHEVNETHVVYFVSDQGIGIAEEAFDVIFDHFSQAGIDEQYKFGGIGMGLSIAKRLVVNMGGEISLASKLGEGSTFYFSVERY